MLSPTLTNVIAERWLTAYGCYGKETVSEWNTIKGYVICMWQNGLFQSDRMIREGMSGQPVNSTLLQMRERREMTRLLRKIARRTEVKS